MQQITIFLLEDERRDWNKRWAWAKERGLPPEALTRRYLTMVTNTVLRERLSEQFMILPYKDNAFDELFYCVAEPRVMQKVLQDFSGDAALSVRILKDPEASRVLMEQQAGALHLN